MLRNRFDQCRARPQFELLEERAVPAVVKIMGTGIADNLHIHYIDSPGGAFSAVPTAYVRTVLSNGFGVKVAEHKVAAVDRIEFYGFGQNDFMHNHTFVKTYAEGHSGNDVFIGGHATDEFWGGKGDDLLIGRGGNDILRGGFGNDTMQGMEGYDFLVGDDGDDELDGGALSDQLYAGAGNDTLKGGAGGDILDGEDGSDWLEGDEGNDIVIGGTGRDTMFGGVGDDILIGGSTHFARPHEALTRLHAEWNSGNPFAIRAKNVMGFPTGVPPLNAPYFLIDGVTVVDDGAKDIMHGGPGMDLAFVEAVDNHFWCEVVI